MCPPAAPLLPPPAPPDFSLTFPPDPAWVRTCRETVRTCALGVQHKTTTGVALPREGVSRALAELSELAVLLTSEAATNAIAASTAAACPYHITLYGEWLPSGDGDGGGGDANRLRIHVRDAAPGIPYVVDDPALIHDDEAESGRGMQLIAALASRYGVCLNGPGLGKSFWFQVERKPGTEEVW